MAWTTPRTWTTSEVVTASHLNTHVRDNENELRTGGIAIASQAAADWIIASSATQFSRVAGASGVSWTPVLGGSGGTSGQSYASQSGTYSRFGPLVVATFDLTLSTKGTITSVVQIQGLPITTAGQMHLHVSYADNWTTSGPQSGIGSGTVVNLYAYGTSYTTLATANVNNNTRVAGVVVYFIS